MSLVLVLMGTPEFAVPAFERIIADGHRIAAVYTQPPRPAGRGMAPRPSPVETLARKHGLPVETPLSLKSDEALGRLEALNADAGVVVAYGLLLPPRALASFRHGAFNLHASKLPRWRGAAPIQRAIMAGDRLTAASIMRMGEGLDTGPVCLEEDIPITPQMTAADLHDRLAVAGAALMSRALKALQADRLVCQPQSSDGVTYAAKVTKYEARIDFAREAAAVVSHIHGLSPSPGAWFTLGGQRVKVLRAESVPGAGPPGTIIDDRLAIACGSGAVRPLLVQREGKAQLPLDDFLRGQAVAPNTTVG